MSGNLESVCGVAIRLRVEQSGVRIPVEAREHYLLENVQAGCGAYPADRSVGTGVLSPGNRMGGA
jgi:hypothetical protein